ncbi:glycosyltransferase family 4 protein [Chitinophagaceae bacterium LWZ2-11]
MRIAISNPSKQYTHQTVAALVNHKEYQVYFLTSFWYTPKTRRWHRLLTKIPGGKQIIKKSSAVVPDEIVIMHWSGIFFSFFGRFVYKGEKRSFIEDKIHDKWTTKWVKKNKPDIFIGYEKSCLNAFKSVKQYSGKTILDLAQVHPKFIVDLRNNFDFFKNITGDIALFNAVTQKKMDEYSVADHIITLSSFAKQTLTDNGISPDKISQVTLGFNPQSFKQKQHYSKNTSNPLKLIFCGTVIPRKGLNLLFDLMRNDFKDLNIELKIVGPIGEGIALSQFLNEGTRISYHSYLQQDELAKQLYEADVFTFPSYLDSWAMVVIEAMAVGLPVIITQNTGAKDAVSSSTGFVIDVNDKEILKEKILHFYTDRTLIEAKGRAAAESVKNYTWINYYYQINTVIQSLILKECLIMNNR